MSDRIFEIVDKPNDKNVPIDKNNVLLFYSGSRSTDKDLIIFSQWYLDENGFTDENNITYYSREQYMMYQKAKLFDDKELMEKIMDKIDEEIIDILRKKKTKKDRDQMINKLMKDIKSYGRDVKKFNQKIWDEKKYDIVKRGNYLHFSQNKVMQKILLNTGNKYIAEASPYDKIWGIGYGANNALEHISFWGQNLLGKAIMDVRKELNVLVLN